MTAAVYDHTLLYDADCGFCRTALGLVLRADTGRRLRPLALHTAEADRLLADLTPEERDASWHLVEPDGHRTSAGTAAPVLLRLLPAGDGPAAVLAAAPAATNRAYFLVSERRSTWSHLIPDAVKARATRLIAARTRAAESSRAPATVAA